MCTGPVPHAGLSVRRCIKPATIYRGNFVKRRYIARAYSIAVWRAIVVSSVAAEQSTEVAPPPTIMASIRYAYCHIHRHAIFSAVYRYADSQRHLQPLLITDMHIGKRTPPPLIGIQDEESK